MGNSSSVAEAHRPHRSVLIVEDQAALRTLLASTLQQANFEVTVCGTAVEAIAAFEKADPDVLLTDIHLGSKPDGVDLAIILRAKAPYLGLVFFTSFPAHLAFKKTVTPPSDYAFLHKDHLTSLETLTEAIESALDDSRPALRYGQYSAQELSRLTKSQLELVRLIAAGLSNAEIAEYRRSSLRSVERLITRTFEVLGLAEFSGNSRVAAANMYTQHYGYVTREDLER